MAVDTQALLRALQTVPDPNTGLDFVSTKAIQGLRCEGGAVSFVLELGYPAQSQWPALRQALERAALEVPGVEAVAVEVSGRVLAHAATRGVPLMPGVKNVLAVASGKGGVGKSTTAVNLALALAAEGARVGLLDADIYGPSLPLLMGLQGRPESHDGKTMEPLIGHGVQVNSIGFLVEPGQAVIWRGPMATQALDQLLRQTHWQELDYLIVDLPPGTGDIHLSLVQRSPLTAAVIVTTPQDVALLDARKGISMFEKVGVPVLGLIENMAVYHCPQCGHEAHIFGSEGGHRMAAELKLPYLGAMPLHLQIREQSDRGLPVVVAEPHGELAGRYLALARQVGAALARLGKDYSSRLPGVRVQGKD